MTERTHSAGSPVPPSRGARRARLLLPLLLAILATAGCSRSSSVTLLQPQAPPAQRILKLAGESAFSRQHGALRTLLLAFPSPGSGRNGPRDFVIYLAAPDHTGIINVGPVAADGIASGFMIQAIGKRAGKATFSGGSLNIHRDPRSLGAECVDLDIRCNDGTRITGRAFPHPAMHELLAFERRYAADIAAALAPANLPKLAADSTPPDAAPPETSETQTSSISTAP